jgi:glycosyltransferase involved in cell wall biosynthesis
LPPDAPVFFSVVMPSYQQGRFIRRSIESVLSQSGSSFEFFVADGGSSDGTVDILREYEDRLTWISEKDRGQADAVNKGMSHAQGEVIAWLNSDDIYYPGALATVEQFLRANPGVDVVYGDANHIDEADNVMEPYPSEDWNPQRLFETCYLCQPATFFRRRMVERFGHLDVALHYSLDYEYWLRLSAGGVRFAHIDAVLAGSRLHAETKTLGSRLKVHAEVNDMFRSKFGRVPDRWIYNYAHAVLEQRGIPREERLKFATLVSWESWKAAIRWQGRLSKPVLATTSRWIRDNAWMTWKERGAR